MSLRPTFALPSNAEPSEGPRGLAISLVFAGASSIDGETTLEQMQNLLSFVQSIYIDNSAVGTAFNITFQPFGYNIAVKANQQGIWPVICGPGACRFRATAAGAGTVKIILANCLIQPATWGV